MFFFDEHDDLEFTLVARGILGSSASLRVALG